MAGHTKAPEGPDFAAGIGIDALEDGTILKGHVRGTPALAVRRGDTFRIVGATCTHYGLPLEQGLVVDEELHCPWHHARFCLKNGAAVGAPALDAIDSWQVEQRDGIVRALEKQPIEAPISFAVPPGAALRQQRFVIIGGGAAGHAAAEMMRAEGHTGTITILSEDADPPYDRPKCSKALLTGAAQPEALILRQPVYYEEKQIDLRTSVSVTSIDPTRRVLTVREANGERTLEYDSLLIATGAAPVTLDVPGATLSHVHYLRTLSDARSLIDAAGRGHRAVVVGASFIGLEAAAGLRTRGLEVHVVAPAPLPMEKLLGKQLSDKLRAVHEQHGVRFHVGSTVSSIDDKAVHLTDGTSIDADVVVVGIGVAPRIELAKAAGLKTADGILVDATLQTSIPGIYAAGDVAEWPDPFSGVASPAAALTENANGASNPALDAAGDAAAIAASGAALNAGATAGRTLRIEHWVVAERQGQAVARALLGRPEPFRESPFFWSIQYDFGIGYIGHASHWDRTETQGDLDKQDWSMTYYDHDQPRAMAIVSRNLDGLEMEVELERRMQTQQGM